MQRNRLIPLLLVPALLLSGIVSAGPTTDNPLVVTNGNFEQGFDPVVIGGLDGMAGHGWTPFLETGQARFQAGQIDPPLNRWQVIAGIEGPYQAGIYQQIGGLEAGSALRAAARVYPPQSLDGIAKVIGIDPLGGSDPAAPGIIWSEPGSGSSWQSLSVTATVAATQTTIFVRLTQPAAAAAGDVYIDDVGLARYTGISHMFLPTLAFSTTVADLEGWQYAVSNIITGTASCNSTGIHGVIHDAAGNLQSRMRVAVWPAGETPSQVVSAPSAADGRWEVVINPAHAQAGRWMMAVVNQAGSPISPIVGEVGFVDSFSQVEAPGMPTHDDCVNGHQWLTIDFGARSNFPGYTLASVRYLSCTENHLNHHLRVWFLDESGTGRRDIPVRFNEGGGFIDDMLTGRDPYKPPGYIDYPMFARQDWTVYARDTGSDIASRLSSQTPPLIETCGGNAWGHYSYEVVFQHHPG